MNFVDCDNRKRIELYIDFIKKLYSTSPNYRDYTTPIIREILLDKSCFSRMINKFPYLIYNDDELVGVVTYIVHREYSNVIQAAFLEYKDVGVNLPLSVIKKASEISKELNIKSIVIGLNGHVNYGLGLSLKDDNVPTFGGSYTKPYYINYLRELGCFEVPLTSFLYDFNPPKFPIDCEKIEKLMKSYTFRAIDNKNFKRDINIYTDLNNKCFLKHPFYYKRSYEEDLELFSTLKFFMEKGSLIFAEKNGKPIGFLLWYPDWGEIMGDNETVSPLTYIKKLLTKKRVKTLKIVEWAVLPKYQGKGVAIGLLYYCYLLNKDKGYKRCKTSWILEENINSAVFGHRWAEKSEGYSVFTLNLGDEASECISKEGAV